MIELRLDAAKRIELSKKLLNPNTLKPAQKERIGLIIRFVNGGRCYSSFTEGHGWLPLYGPAFDAPNDGSFFYQVVDT